MKKISLIILFVAISCLSPKLFAQTIRETMLAMSQGTHNALVTELPTMDLKEINKKWEKHIKQFDGKIKIDKKRGEILTDNCIIKEIGGNNTVDVYAAFTQNNNVIQLAVWYDLGGAYLSSQAHPAKYPAAEKVLTEFSAIIARSLVESELETEIAKQNELSNHLKNLSKDKNTLEKQIENDKKAIEDAKEKIAKWEEAIELNKNKVEQNKQQQDTKQRELEIQMEKVKTVKNKLEAMPKK